MSIYKKEMVDALFEKLHNFAESSNCMKKKVSAMMVDYSTGIPVTTEVGGPTVPCKECTRKTRTWTQDGCWSVHAEPRAIFSFFREYGYTQNLSGLIMLTTHGPCDQCIKYMQFFGITDCIYDIEYKTEYEKWGDRIKIFNREQWATWANHVLEMNIKFNQGR